jgi:hypothetical protein
VATVHIEFDSGTIVTYEGVDDNMAEEMTLDYFEGLYPYSIKV